MWPGPKVAMSSNAGRSDQRRPRQASADADSGSPRLPPDGKVSESPRKQPRLSTAHKRTASGNPRPPPSSTGTSVSTTAANTSSHKTTERTVATYVESLPIRHSQQSPRSPEKPEREERRNDGSVDTQPIIHDGAQQQRRAAETKTKSQRQRVPENTVPWGPEASLVPRTTAPLASRISIPPLASTMPRSLQPRPMAELSLEEQEAAVLEDLLFVFMGYEGQYIRFDAGYDPSLEQHRLSGPNFVVLPGLDPSLLDLTRSMLKMATYYSALEAFVDVQSREEFGAVNHALCAAVRKFLHDYVMLVAQLETQFLTDDGFTVHVLNIHTLSTSQMMFQLYSLARELLKRSSLLGNEAEDGDESDDSANYADVLMSLREVSDGSKICRGGAVLDLVTRRLEALSGDPAARALLTSLLRDASRPYMAMLNEWLHRGGIHDPHGEFLIREQKSIRRERLEEDYTDDYWEKRYVMRLKDVPPQLEAVKDKVLLAGKYLNVVRECGGVNVSTEVRDVPTSFDDPRFLENINAAYAHANESLMLLLLTTHALPARLGSLKHYFFLSPCDYFSYFLELGASELAKRVQSVNTGKLQSLLDLVLRQPGSVVSLDPFKEDVKVEMNEVTLIHSLQRVVNITGIEQGESLPAPVPNQPAETDKHGATGFSSLQLDYSVPFPVSLVISRKTIWRYQALFRHLLSLRHLESQLASSWLSHYRGHVRTTTSRRTGPSANASPSPSPSPASTAPTAAVTALEILKRRVRILRARMLVFVQQQLYFCTAEVIEPNWQRFVSRLIPSTSTAASAAGPPATLSTHADFSQTGSGSVRTASVTRTVDELMQDHVDLLDTCLKECGLTNGKLLKIYGKVIQSCTVFATNSHWLSQQLERASADATQSDGANAKSQVTMSMVSDIVLKTENNFGRHLQILLDVLNHYAATETVALLGLCARLSTANDGTGWAGPRLEDEGVV